ncbi:MAG: hypothetical protein ACTH59_05365 [Pseudoalteromonas nigrifaciens]|uniref:hypothetical protein n=1 Tax=Pseudoalteromonas nigrifaciens TaxID=28109 RepID=UPI003F9A9990
MTPGLWHFLNLTSLLFGISGIGRNEAYALQAAKRDSSVVSAQAETSVPTMSEQNESGVL